MTTDQFIDRYFQDQTQYPSKQLMREVKEGCLYEYVSSSYINGVINYTKPVAGFVIDRYVCLNEPFDKPMTISLMEESPIDGKTIWVKHQYTTKKEALDIINVDKRGIFHQSFDIFQDDVILLCHVDKIDEKSNEWAYFWLDCDVSDCSFGRFITSDPGEEIHALFSEHVTQTHKQVSKSYQGVASSTGPYPIDVKKFQGWMSW